MQTIQVQLPDTVIIDAQEIQMLLAGKLYEKDLLSIGQDLEMSEITSNTSGLIILDPDSIINNNQHE